MGLGECSCRSGCCPAKSCVAVYCVLAHIFHPMLTSVWYGGVTQEHTHSEFCVGRWLGCVGASHSHRPTPDTAGAVPCGCVAVGAHWGVGACIATTSMAHELTYTQGIRMSSIQGSSMAAAPVCRPWPPGLSRAHETILYLVCRLLLEKKQNTASPLII